MDLKTKVPGLFAFNRMALVRRGNVPCNIILLKGSESDIKAVVDHEAKYFFDNGLSLNEIVVTDKNDTNTPQVYLFDSIEGVVTNCGSIYFVTSISGGIDHNTYDVTGIVEDPAFKNFATNTGFDNIDEITSWLQESKHVDGVKILITKNRDNIINNLLESHFTKFEDNICHKEELSFLFSKAGNMTTLASKSESKSVKQNIETTSTPQKVEQKMESVGKTKAKTTSEIKNTDSFLSNLIQESKKETNLNKDTEPRGESKTESVVKTENTTKSIESIDETKSLEQKVQHGNTARKMAQFSKQRDEKSKQRKIEEEENEATGFSPKPVEKKENKNIITAKKYLTVEEEAKNKALLDDITKMYQETMDFIDNTCNTQYRIIKNRMEEALKTKKFRQQYSPMYLDISDDLSTELYTRLYNLDIATAKFVKELTFQLVDIGCPFCGKSWKQDITFYTPGIHYIECPECAAERPYEKKSAIDTDDES